MALKIIMYHYVRDTDRTSYKKINACSVKNFIFQVENISKHCCIIGYGDFIDMYDKGHSFNDSEYVMFTFDDGFADHYANVCPILDKMNVPGLFFPPAQPILEGKMLDVHKVHLILATARVDSLCAHIMNALRHLEQKGGFISADECWRQFAVPSRFDSAEVIFVKRMLQLRLPQPLRRQVVDELFRTHVSEDEAAMAAEWYLSIDQLRHMTGSGHYIGGHGYAHHWMDQLTLEEKWREIEATVAFLSGIGAPTTDWIMAYPYGAHDDTLPGVLRDHGCLAAMGTTVAAVTDVNGQRWALPRLDTNDVTKANFAWID